MLNTVRLGLLVCLLYTLADVACADEQLICCGGPEVFILSATGEITAAEDRSWRWTAADSPEIPAEMRGQFRTTDECKPYDDRLLITSSSGGVALVRRKDKRCLFHTSVKNAHSACLLPKERIAVASSTGGDELLIYSLARSGEKIAPLARLTLLGAHGTVWDRKRERLWVLGTRELLLVEVQETDDKLALLVNDRWELPTVGGHDLSPARDARYLYVTSNSAVYRFDTEAKRFQPFEPLAKAIAVKSIDEHPATGEIVFHQADHEQKVWWSDTIRRLQPAGTMHLQGERLYKVRWDVKRE